MVTGLATGALGAFLRGVAWHGWRGACWDRGDQRPREAFEGLPVGMVVEDSAGARPERAGGEAAFAVGRSRT